VTSSSQAKRSNLLVRIGRYIIEGKVFGCAGSEGKDKGEGT
jgi:hypothetical protein